MGGRVGEFLAKAQRRKVRKFFCPVENGETVDREKLLWHFKAAVIFIPMNKKKRRRLHQLCPLITIARLQPNLRLRPSRRSERLFRPSSAAANFRARTGYLHFSTTLSKKLSKAMTTT